MAHDDTVPVPADWLALREPADDDARRTATLALLDHLLPALSARTPAPGERDVELAVVDLGAGTGANLRHLAPALGRALGRALGQALDGAAQRWTLLDHDEDLLRRAGSGAARSERVTASTRLGDLADLPALLPRGGTQPGGPPLVTCAALLDLLRPEQVTSLVRTVVQAGAPALFALTVTGAVDLEPAHPADDLLREAFDAHQQRGGRLGPAAAGAAVQAFTDAGARVLAVPTPWHLGPGWTDLLRAWLDGRAEAAAQQRPELGATAAAWRSHREEQLTDGGLTAVVHHVDLAAVPPS